MTKYSMRSIPAAAAMVAALAFGAQVHAQSTMAPAMNNTNKDITAPAPGTPAMPSRTGAAGTAVAPTGGMATTAATGGTGDGGSTAIPGVKPKDADQRTMDKENKKSMKVAKRAAKKSQKSQMSPAPVLNSDVKN